MQDSGFRPNHNILSLIAWTPAIAATLYFAGGVLPPALHFIGLHHVADALAMVYSHSCHQIPERTLSLDSYLFNFCARCTGMYGAMALVSVLVVMRGITKPISWQFLTILSLPAILDFVLGLTGTLLLSNVVRSITGALAGTGVVLFTYPRLIAAIRYSLAPGTTSA